MHIQLHVDVAFLYHPHLARPWWINNTAIKYRRENITILHTCQMCRGKTVDAEHSLSLHNYDSQNMTTPEEK